MPLRLRLQRLPLLTTETRAFGPSLHSYSRAWTLMSLRRVSEGGGDGDAQACT